MHQNDKLGWALFLLLGCAMAYLRYGYLLWPTQPEMLNQNVPALVLGFQTLRQWGPWIVLGCHVLITLGAFREAVFQGILCVLIPFYSFYFLFVVWDHFVFRAIAGALLVAVGQDSAAFFQEHAVTIMDTVTKWIGSGG